jgi:hypothetical protein
MHVVGFDSTGESIELRITARDRSAYVAGALLASDWLQSGGERPTGIVRFDTVVKRVLEAPAVPSTNRHRAAAGVSAKEESHGHR